MKNTRHLFRVLTWAGIAALAVLSWTPGDYMIRTGADGHLEHVAAYVLASAVAARDTADAKDTPKLARLIASTPGCWSLARSWSPVAMQGLTILPRARSGHCSAYR